MKTRLFLSVRRLAAAFLLSVVLLTSSLGVQAAYEGQESTPFAEENSTYLPFVIRSDGPATVNNWDAVGPDGGTFTAVAVDPSNPAVVYVGTYGAGIYKSVDSGATWSQNNAGLTGTYIQSLAIDPTNSLVLYAGSYGSGVFKSVDEGKNWQAASGTAIENHIVYDIMIHPGQSQILYAATRVNGSLVGYLYKSADGGASWKLLFSGNQFPDDDYFYDVTINPHNPSEVFLTAHEHGFFRSVDGGASFAAINAGVTDLSARSVAFDSNTPGLVYGGVWHGDGVFRSLNNGDTWSRQDKGLPDDVEVYRLVVNNQTAGTQPVFACTYEDGLYRSVDRAATWTSKGLDGQFLYDFAINPELAGNWFAATSFRGLYSSKDAGVTWKPSHAGVSSANITGMASLPAQSGFIYAGVFGVGVMRTADNGSHWVYFNAGLEDLYVTDLISLGNRMYALTPSGVFFSSGAAWTRLALPTVSGIDADTYFNEIQMRVNLPEALLEKSADDQVSALHAAGVEAGNLPLTSLASLNGVLFGGTSGKGVWVYSAGVWKQIGLNGYSILSMAADNLLNRLLISACDAGGSCAVWAYRQGTWSVINEGLAGLRTNAVIVRGDDYFAATTSGIFLRDNSGSFWHRVAAQSKNIVSIGFSPQNSCFLAAGSLGSAYYSTNCGTVWFQTEALNNAWTLQSIVFNANNPSLVLFGSKEAGVYRWNISQ